MEPTNLKQLIVDNYKSVHQSVTEMANDIPWSDIWAKTRLNALKVYRSSSRLYTISSNWVRGVDWAKQWDTAQNVAALVAAISTVAYERAKPYVIQAYNFTKKWAKKIEWMEVLEIVLLGLNYLLKGAYAAGLWTGHAVYAMNDALAREFVYLTGALERPAPATPTTPTATNANHPEHQGNARMEFIIPAVFGEGDVDLGGGWVMHVSNTKVVEQDVEPHYEEGDDQSLDALLDQITIPVIEDPQPSDEDQATNPFIEEIIDELMEQLTENSSNTTEDRPQKQNTEQAESDLQNSADSICKPSVHPTLVQLESLTVKQLREIAGIFNKQVKKEDLIQAAALTLACW